MPPSQAASLKKKMLFVYNTLDSLPATEQLRIYLDPLSQYAGLITIDLTTLVIRHQMEGAFWRPMYNWDVAVNSAIQIEYAGETPKRFSMVNSKYLSLEKAFLKACESRSDGAIKAMNTAIKTYYAQASAEVDDILKKLSPHISKTASSFHDQFSGLLLDILRIAWATYRIRIALHALVNNEGKVIDDDERGRAIELKAYEELVNVVLDHLQPSFVQSANSFYAVMCFFWAVFCLVTY